MFTPIQRIVLGILALILAGFSYSIGNTLNALFVLFAPFLILSGYFRNGTVYIAFRQFKKANYDKAEQLLSTIKNPNLLSKSQKNKIGTV